MTAAYRGAGAGAACASPNVVGREHREFDFGRQREMVFKPFANPGQEPRDLVLAVFPEQGQEDRRGVDDLGFEREALPHDLVEKDAGLAPGVAGFRHLRRPVQTNEQDSAG
jgi:hypothetical protein